MVEKKSQALQARVRPNHPDTKVFRAYATAYELDDSELLSPQGGFQFIIFKVYSTIPRK